MRVVQKAGGGWERVEGRRHWKPRKGDTKHKEEYIPLHAGNEVWKWHFYRAMHFSAKRGIAIACRLSLRLSVCNVGEL